MGDGERDAARGDRGRAVRESVAEVLERAQVAALQVDEHWRLAWVSTQLMSLRRVDDPDDLGLGEHLLAGTRDDVWRRWGLESEDELMSRLASYVASATPGGAAGLADIAQAYRDIVARTSPVVPPPVWTAPFRMSDGERSRPVGTMGITLRDEDGSLVGTVMVLAPSLPAEVLALVSQGDEAMFARMAELTDPARRAAAVVFTDLEDSTELSRRLPTEAYFALVRDLTTAIDALVAGEGGVVGKHAGDGASAFFLAEVIGSESGAARSAAAVALQVPAVAREVVADLVERGLPLDGEEVPVNVGLHWGPNLYIGQIVTGGRLEVTAIGDEVNECARLQQGAGGGQVLASKVLLERLDDADAAALGIDRANLTYRPLAEEGRKAADDEKALRDAGRLPVVDLSRGR